MSQAAGPSWVRHPISTAASVLGLNVRSFSPVDPDLLRRAATVSVWLQWSVAVFFVIQMAYRPFYGLDHLVAYSLALSLLVAYTGYVHYRLATNRAVPWRWILGILSLDVALVSAAVVVGGGFSHYFIHLLYYPVLAGYAVAFTSFRLTMALVTMVAVLYLAISLTETL